MQRFGNQQRMAAAWLRANRPSTENGDKGTEAYQMAQSLKKSYRMSNVRQVVLKYMDEDGNVNLPTAGSATVTPPSGGGSVPCGSDTGGSGGSPGPGCGNDDVSLG